MPTPMPNTPHTPFQPHRRHLLHTLGAGMLVGGLAPSVWAQAAPAGNLGQGRLIVVFLRGAYDGLSALVPYSDANYYKLRPTIGIAAPDGTAQTALKLDDRFALHPALAPLLPLWQQGVLGVVPAAGLGEPNRSHFDAQYQMEIAQAGKLSHAPGWLNKLAQLQTQSVAALGVGETNPAILAGSAAVQLIPHGQAAQQTGVLANDGTRQALLDLYAGNDNVSKAFRQGAGSRIDNAKELSAAKASREAARKAQQQATAQKASLAASAAGDGHAPDGSLSPSTLAGMQPGMDGSMDGNMAKGMDGKPSTAASAQMLAASNGAADPVGLQLDAQQLGTLMRRDASLRIGFLSAGGWDTHVNQGSVNGQLANNLGNLARAIAQLRQDFNAPGDTIVVMSEFGRTSAENGTRGTDHGFGNALWLVGNRIHGGRWHGQWTGLAQANLHQGRDLPAHHDYRSVLAQVLRATFALPDSQLQTILPGAQWDTRLDGMVRKV
jgi:uncharacterized protein (DUF1501 family)